MLHPSVQLTKHFLLTTLIFFCLLTFVSWISHDKSKWNNKHRKWKQYKIFMSNNFVKCLMLFKYFIIFLFFIIKIVNNINKDFFSLKLLKNQCISCFFNLFFLIWDRFLWCSSGSPWNHYVVQAGFKLKIILSPQPPMCLNYKYNPIQLATPANKEIL